MRPTILVLNAHPRVGSLADGLADAYASAAREVGADVTVIAIRDLTFDPTLRGGYAEPTPLEPDLERLQQQIADCDHLAVVTPLWWNSVPAPFKGLIDRIILPGFGFRYVEGKPLPERLLAGRSARILITMDSPRIYQTLYAGDTAVRMLRRNVIGFCGFKPVHLTRFSPIHQASPDRIATYLKKAARVGAKDGARDISDAQRAARKTVHVGTLTETI